MRTASRSASVRYAINASDVVPNTIRTIRLLDITTANCLNQMYITIAWSEYFECRKHCSGIALDGVLMSFAVLVLYIYPVDPNLSIRKWQQIRF